MMIRFGEALPQRSFIDLIEHLAVISCTNQGQWEPCVIELKGKQRTPSVTHWDLTSMEIVSVQKDGSDEQTHANRALHRMFSHSKMFCSMGGKNATEWSGD